MDRIRIEADGLVIEAWAECGKKHGADGDVHLTIEGCDDEPVMSSTTAHVLGIALVAMAAKETE
jgi:hypothetical protein